MISSNRFASFFVAAGLLAAASLGRAQTQTLYVPQVADGGSWQTTLVITNATTTAQPLSLSFYSEIAGGTGGTQTWSLNFLEPVPASIPAASTVFLHTLGTNLITFTGWGAITTGPGVTAYAIFSQAIGIFAHQDGTAAAIPAASRFLVPFDQNGIALVGIAIANTSNAAETVNLAVKNSSGAVASGAIRIPAQGHFNFALSFPPSGLGSIATAVASTTGLLEIYASNPNLAVLALRFNDTAAPSPFTASPVYAEAGPPIIGTAAGSTAAPFTALYVTGNWTLTSTNGSILVDVTPNSDGTYKAAVVEQSPLLLVTFTGGTLQNQTLTFNSIGSNGLLGASAVTGGSLTLTVANFDQAGSNVSGSMSVTTSSGTTTGSITGTSTYQP